MMWNGCYVEQVKEKEDLAIRYGKMDIIVEKPISVK